MRETTLNLMQEALLKNYNYYFPNYNLISFKKDLKDINKVKDLWVQKSFNDKLNKKLNSLSSGDLNKFNNKFINYIKKININNILNNLNYYNFEFIYQLNYISQQYNINNNSKQYIYNLTTLISSNIYSKYFQSINNLINNIINKLNN